MPVSIWTSLLVSLFLLLLAVALMISHVRTWRRVRQRHGLTPKDLDYARRQYRRRMQTSAMLGLLAVTVFLGQLVVSQTESKVVELACWSVALLLAGWVSLLALVDMLSTRYHFNRMRHDYIVEQAKLQAELHRIQAARGNGKARGTDRPSKSGD